MKKGKIAALLNMIKSMQDSVTNVQYLQCFQKAKKHDTIEVIGNVFDNPELLESEEN